MGPLSRGVTAALRVGLPIVLRMAAGPALMHPFPMTQIRPLLASLGFATFGLAATGALTACGEGASRTGNTAGSSSAARTPAGTIGIGVGATPGKPGFDGVTRGIQLAVERLNADAGGSVRFSVTLPTAATSAVQIAQQLRDDPGVIGVVGHPESGTTLEAIPVYADAEHGGANAVVAISPTASSPRLSGVSPWFFRIAPSDNEAARLVAHYVSDSLRAKSTAVVYRNDSYGRDWTSKFTETFTGRASSSNSSDSANKATRAAGSVLARLPYLTGITEWKAYALQLKKLAPQVLLFPGDADDAAELLRELKANDVKLTFVGGDGTEGLARTHEFPEAKYAAFFLPDRATSAEGKKFVDTYKAKYNEAPDMFSALSYDAALAIGRTVLNGAKNRADLRRSLERITGPNAIEGAGGPIAFNGQHDITGRTIVIETVGPAPAAPRADNGGKK
jgi:ABC-type branched-subunit amino acid transport system substrate-binding protein